MSKTISIRLNKQEEKIFNEYAAFKGITLSTLFKETLIERIEEEFDMQAIEEYEEDAKVGNTQTYTIQEVNKLLDL